MAARLFVANANRNTVTSLDTATGQPTETLLAELQPGALSGQYAELAGAVAGRQTALRGQRQHQHLAVFDVEERGEARSLGFIPVGWYPTTVRLTPDGRKLLVANGKGTISRSNRHSPVPGQASVGGVE